MKHIYDIVISHPSFKEAVIFGDSFGTYDLASKVVASIKKTDTRLPKDAEFEIVERNLIESADDLLAAIADSGEGVKEDSFTDSSEDENKE